ncbi:MAG: hypothetical protein GX817_04105, partial [Elusimicrobia bacterium]|nr:hypothetical protein [Elusimicrobiota bacterium]
MVFFILISGGISGVLLSHDIFLIYLFLELIGLSSFFLTDFYSRKKDSRVGFKSAAYSASGSSMILFGIGILYAATG